MLNTYTYVCLYLLKRLGQELIYKNRIENKVSYTKISIFIIVTQRNNQEILIIIN